MTDLKQGGQAEAQGRVSGEFTRGGEPGLQGSGTFSEIYGDVSIGEPGVQGSGTVLDFFGTFGDI